MESKKKQNTAIITVSLFFIGFILGCFSGVLYTVLHDIKTRGETNQAFIENYIDNNMVQEEDYMEFNTETEDSVIGTSDKNAKDLEPQEMAVNDSYFILINKEDINIEEYAISLIENYLKDGENILSVLNTKTNIMHTLSKDETGNYIYITSIEYRNNGSVSNLENEDLFVNYEIDLNTKNIIKY